jgi:chemotaxis protein CheX
MVLPLTNDEIAGIIRAVTENVFSTMLGVQVQPGGMTVHTIMADQTEGVVAFVGFTGNWTGSGSIRCNGQSACIIGGKLLMTDFAEVNEEVLDALGEVANMIIGNFKDEAACKLGPLALSTPTVIHGNSFHTRNWNGQSWITVPFTCEGESFEIKICLVPGNAVREPLRPAGLAVRQ